MTDTIMNRIWLINVNSPELWLFSHFNWVSFIAKVYTLKGIPSVCKTPKGMADCDILTGLTPQHSAIFVGVF